MRSGWVWKCFVYKWLVGDKPTSYKIVKKLKKTYMKRILRGLCVKAILHLIVGE